MFPFSRRGTFYGGIFLPASKSTTEGSPIQVLPLPRRLFVAIPRDGHRQIERGDAVTAGQALCGGPGATCGPHSAVDGVAAGVTEIETAYQELTSAVEIEVQQETFDLPQTVDGPGDGAALSDEEIGRRLAKGGVTCAPEGALEGRCGIGEAKQRPPRQLIVSGVEAEPCLTSEHRLLMEHLPLVVSGVSLLQQYLEAPQAFLVLDRARKSLMRRAEQLAEGAALRVVGLPNRYPIDAGPLLVQSLLGQEVPAGRQPLDIGVAVMSVQDVFHAARAVILRQPRTATLTTVTGDAVERPGNYWIPQGTRVDDILQHVGLRYAPTRLIAGGPMTGRALPHDRVVLTGPGTALLALGSRTVDHHPPSACVHCGWCLDVCPMRLDPAALFNAIELRRPQTLDRLHVDVCIECGLCSYVCPSSLPLAGRIGIAKRHRP